MVTGVCTSGVKYLGLEANHSLPSSAKVKNAWSYISTPPCVFMACCSSTGTTLPLSAVSTHRYVNMAATHSCRNLNDHSVMCSPDLARGRHLQGGADRKCGRCDSVSVGMCPSFLGSKLPSLFVFGSWVSGSKHSKMRHDEPQHERNLNSVSLIQGRMFLITA